MKEILGRNITRYRKDKGLTQEGLAQILGVTFQAVSKWENSQTMPDVSLLPLISEELGVSIDKLFGYNTKETQVSFYEEAYNIEDYYWGIVPSTICYKVLEQLPPTKHLRLLDIGCGEGKDAIFFARNGYDVTAFDISEAGVRKTKKLADKFGVNVNVFRADLLDHRLSSNFDIIYSSGVFHYIASDYRSELINNYKQHTNLNGIHVLNVFVEKPFIAPPPENEPNAHKWHSGELLRHYHDWLVIDSSEIIFDCNSSGIPHKHAMTKLMVQRVDS
jgi:tellurite methyltransferase